MAAALVLNKLLASTAFVTCVCLLTPAVERVIIMGGSERENSFTKTGAEFNFYCDPEAAQTVIAKVSDQAA